MSGMDELQPCTVLMWMLSSALMDPQERPFAHSTQLGRARQGVLGAEDKVGDEPRVLVDFNKGQPLLSAGGVQVGAGPGTSSRCGSRSTWSAGGGGGGPGCPPTSSAGSGGC